MVGKAENVGYDNRNIAFQYRTIAFSLHSGDGSHHIPRL